MLVGTFNAATGWAGRKITHDGGRFLLEGHGEVSAAAVLQYAQAGQLDWSSDEIAAWVASAAQQTGHPKPTAVNAQTSHSSIPGVLSQATARLGVSRQPLWVWGAIGAGIVAVVLLALFLPSMLGQSKTDKLVAVVKADLPKADRVLDLEIQASDADRQGDSTRATALYQQAQDEMGLIDDHYNLKMRPDGKGGLLYDAYASYIFEITNYGVSAMLENATGSAPSSPSDVLGNLQNTRRDVEHFLQDLQ